MSEQEASLGGRGPVPPNRRGLNRRAFLATSALGVAGFTLYPSAAHASPVFDAVATLAGAVGASAGDEVNAYIRQQRVSKLTALEVERVNCTAHQTPFSDFNGSRVYVLREDRSYFFYPVRHRDGFNALVNFFDGRQGPDSELVGRLGGPTLFGIASLALTMAQKYPGQVVGRTLLPRQVNRSEGLSMERSYAQPDEYRSEEGLVQARYVIRVPGRGTVSVEVKNGKGTVLAGGDYDLTYAADG